MSLTIGNDVPPPFWEMTGIPFQQFCRDIIAKDPLVETCDQYGRVGKTDHGVDLRSPLKDQTGVLLAQCKAYKTFPVNKIKKASDAFFKHWTTQWSDKNVKFFYLIVACDLTDTEQQKEVARQKDRFAKYGITYVCWSASTLVTQLKPHEEIVLRYCGPHATSWAEYICGKRVSQKFATPSDTTTTALVDAAVVDQLRRLVETIAGDAKKLLDVAINQWKEGDTDGADKSVAALEGDSSRWSALDAETKAQLLCFRGKLALELADHIEAETYAQRASGLGVFPCTSNLKSLIALAKKDIASVENELGNCLPEDAVRVRASMLLQLGRAEDAVKCLQDFESSDDILSPDLLRLKALALLLTKQVNQALVVIDKSLALQPKWKYSRLVGAVVRYYAAISVLEIPDVLPPWPCPVHWETVKECDEARKRLEESADLFRGLLASPNLRVAERRELEGWLIAVLSVNTTTQKSAEQLCLESLTRDRSHEAAIAWSVSRKFEIDLVDSERELKKLCDNNQTSPNQVLSLLLILFKSNRFSEAREILDDKQSLFEQKNTLNLWKFWKAQVLLLCKQDDEAVKVYGGIENFPVELLPVVQGDSLREKLVMRDATQDLSGRTMLDVCIGKAKLSDWSYVATYAEKLLSGAQTPQALRLVSESLYMTEDFRACITVLESNQSMFNGQKLPHDLQLLQAECYQRLGLVNVALTKAEYAVVQNPNTHNLLYYAKMLSEAGNLKALQTVVQRLSRRSDLTPVQAIRLASFIFRDDPITARSLWKHATSGKLAGEYVFLAISLGYQLGLEREPAYLALQRELYRLAGTNTGGVKVATLEDVVDSFKQRRKEIDARAKAYSDGTGPAHILCDLPFLYNFAHLSGKNRFPLLESNKVFACHEDRQGALDLPNAIPMWKLNVDISSLMLADKFSFLEPVIEAFSPIHIPTEAIPALLSYRQKISTLPPDRREVLDLIIKTVDSSRITVFDDNYVLPPDLGAAEQADRHFDATLAFAQEQKGFVVEFLPLNRGSSGNLEEEQIRAITDARSVVTSLHAQGLLSAGRHAATMELLPNSNTTEEIAMPPVDSKLFTHTTLVERFASADVLDDVVSRFKLHLPVREVQFVRDEIQNDDAAKETEQWLTSLVEKLNRYIQEGKIELLPALKQVTTDSVEDFPLLPMSSLLSFQGKPGDVLWIDDRFVNAYLQTDRGIPIVTSWEVLRGLAVTPFGLESHYKTLLELRRANIRYLPILHDELLFHLRQAPIKDGRVSETTELRTVQLYVASCMAQDNLMHKHQNNAEALVFLSTIKQSLIVAWDEIWRATDSFDIKIARSGWLMKRLFFDVLSLSLIPFGNELHSSKAGIIGELLFTGLVVFQGAGVQAAEDYMNWLNRRFLRSLFDDEPILVRKVADRIKHYLAAEIPVESEEKTFAVIIFQWWYGAFSEKLKQEVAKDTDSMRKIGLTYVSFGSMYGLTFMLDEFEKKVLDAHSTGEPISVHAKEGFDVEVVAQILTDGRMAITMSYSEKSFSVADDEIQLLFNKPHFRRAAISRNRQWIDVDDEQFEQIASSIAYLEPASARIVELQGWQEMNINRYYAELELTFRSRSKLYLSNLLPPSIESLLNHYRLNNLSKSSFDVGVHAAHLFSIDPVVGTRFLAGLPLELSDLLVRHIETLSSEGYRQLVKQLINTPCPPARFQLLKVLSLREEDRNYRRLKRRVIDRLFSDEQLSEIESFVSLLRWLANQFANWPAARKLAWNVRLLLIWTHASYLYNAMALSAVPDHWIRDTFSQAHQFVSVTVLDMHNPVRNDASSVNAVSAERLFLTGMLYGLTVADLERLQTKLIEFALFQFESDYWPKPNLFQHPSISNSLNSYLAMDIGTAAITIEPFQTMSSDKLSETALSCIERIRSSSDTTFWWLLLQTIAPRPAHPPEVSEAIRALIREIGLLTLMRQTTLVLAPLLVISTHCADDDTLNIALLSDIKLMAQEHRSFIHGSTDEEKVESEHALFVGFIEAGLRLCKEAGELDTEKFTEFMLELMKMCPAFVDCLDLVMDDLWLELPHAVACRLWKLRKYLAASAA